MGLTRKLHRRVVKKSAELKLHRKAIRAMYAAIRVYANPDFWQDTDDTRDVIEGGIVIGVERMKKWVGPGTGPQVAESLLSSGVVVENKKGVKKDENHAH